MPTHYEDGSQEVEYKNPITEHHERNVQDGTFVTNEDGSVSTVKTVILGDGEFEYLIPTVWEGKILSEDEAWQRAMESGVSWPKAPAGSDGVRTLEKLDELLHRDMEPRGYNKGGSVAMEEEMSAIQGRDPVSGNEIPVGAEPEEVRDDIDAKLSKNEFVVPADVVRYFGVAHFENLIKRAKKGWAEMEENGRIGGEEAPPEEEMAEDDLPFSDEELAVVDVPDEPEGEPVEMAEGGVVQPTFDASAFTTGFSTLGGGVENRVYINAQGQRRTVLFIGGVPIQQIPQGYLPDTPQNRHSFEQQVEEEVEKELEQVEEPRTGEDRDYDPELAEAADYTSMTDDQINAETKAGQALAGLVGGAFAGPLGARALKGLAQREQRKELEEQGIPTDRIDDILGKERKPKGLLGKIADRTRRGRVGDPLSAISGLSETPGARAGDTFEGSGDDFVDLGSTEPRRGDDRDDEDSFGATRSETAAVGGLYNKGGLVGKKPKRPKKKTRGKRGLATRK